MSVEVIKTIRCLGYNDIEYTLVSDGPSYMSVYANEIGEKYDEDRPLLYLHALEAKALASALLDLASTR